MQSQTVKEPRRQKSAESLQSRKLAAPKKESVQSQPVFLQDEVQARITDRAYELYAERGYRQGYALDDWLEAERETLGLECNA